MENFTINLDDTSDRQAINNFLSLSKDGRLTISSLVLTGDLTVSGHLTVNNGSDFNGGKHLFADVESNGKKLRVGNPGGIPGIYAETGDIVVGSQSTNVRLNNNLYVNGHLTVTNGSDFSGGRHLFTDSEGTGRLRVGNAWGNPGIYAEDGRALHIGASGEGGKVYLHDHLFMWGDTTVRGGARTLFNGSTIRVRHVIKDKYWDWDNAWRNRDDGNGYFKFQLIQYD